MSQKKPYLPTNVILFSFFVLLFLLGVCQAGYFAVSDINKDGTVDFADFALMAENWQSNNDDPDYPVPAYYEIPILTGQGDNQIAVLSWYEPQGATVLGYNCLRASNPTGPFLKINDDLIITANYTDTGLTNYQRYYYAVTAVCSEPIKFETNRSSFVEVIPTPVYNAIAYTSIVAGSSGKPVQVSDYMQFGSDGGGGSLFYSVNIPSAGDYDVVAKLSNVYDERDNNYLGDRSPDRIGLYVDGQLWGYYDPLGTIGQIDRGLHIKLNAGNHTLEFRDVDGDGTATTLTNLYSFQIFPEEIRDVKLGVGDNWSAHQFQYWEELNTPLIRRPEAWSLIEPSEGIFDWNYSDTQYSGIGTTYPDVEQFPFMYYTPDWASGNSPGNIWDVPNDWCAFEEFVERYTDRYSGKFKTLAPTSEIGWDWAGRSDVTGDWTIDRPLAESLGTTIATPSNYAQWLKHCYMATKRADPDMKIAWAAINPDDAFYVHRRFHEETLAELQRLGGDFFDRHAVNGYFYPRGGFAQGNGETWEPMLARMAADMANYGFQHRICIPESGYPSGPSTGPNANPDFTEVNQARNVIYMMVVSVAFGVDEICYFAMNDYNPKPDPDWWMYYLCLQRNQPTQAFDPKPSYYTLKMLGPLLQGNIHIRYAPAYSPVTGADPSDRIYVFENEMDETIAFFWSDPDTGPTRSGVSIDIPVGDLTAPYTVELWDYQGNTMATPATSLNGNILTVSGLSYDDSPIVLKVR